MGAWLKAKCEQCGFEQDFHFGAGMATYRSQCSVPAIDATTHQFVVENIFDNENNNGKYIFYNDPKMSHQKDSVNILQWGAVTMKKAENFCPSCKSYNLAFINKGCFD